MQKFSNRLISLRKERGLTQEALAALIQKKRSTVSGYETEGKEPDMDTLCFLARYFGVSTDYLLGHSDERNNIDTIFYNDKVHFEQHLQNMPFELRSIVAGCFNSFYLLLDKDIQAASAKHLRLYQALLDTLQSFRTDIRRRTEAISKAAAHSLTIFDLMTLSDLMALQDQMKNEISSLLEQLAQADMEIVSRARNNANAENTVSPVSPAE